MVSRSRDIVRNASPRALPTTNRNGVPDRDQLNLDAWSEALRLLPPAPVNESDIVGWVEEPLRRFVTFKGFLVGYGKWSGGRVHMLSWLSSGHTSEYMAARPSVFDLDARASVAWWVFNQKPFLMDEKGAVDEEGAPVPTNALDLHSFNHFALGLSAIHGVIDPIGKCGSYLCFSGIPRAQSKRFLYALKLIAPVLHTLLLQSKRAKLIDLTVLTDRQRELIDLALIGLSDKGIASRIGISHNTVGNHFRAIYARLGISKRSQLIALLK
jgi:DNA-binding CsgD family transcriptional regulator